MIIDKEGNMSIIFQENVSLDGFLTNFNGLYSKVKNENIIINLSSFSQLGTTDLLKFLETSNAHRAGKKSFVLVTDKVSYDAVPDELCVVPTIQEAKDIVEMEDIERDLDL